MNGVLRDVHGDQGASKHRLLCTLGVPLYKNSITGGLVRHCPIGRLVRATQLYVFSSRFTDVSNVKPRGDTGFVT